MAPTLPCAYYWGEKGRYGCVAGNKCTFSHTLSPSEHQKQQTGANKKTAPRPATNLVRPSPSPPSCLPTTSTQPTTLSPPKSGPASIKSLCRFFSKTGNCVVGLACPFQHSNDPELEAKRRVDFFASQRNPPPPHPLPPPMTQARPSSATFDNEVEWQVLGNGDDETYFFGAPTFKFEERARAPALASPPSSHPLQHPLSVPSQTSSTIPCRFFLKGSCRNGAACRFAHVSSSLSHQPDNLIPPPPSSPSQHPTCTICCDAIISTRHRFGILQNCFHTFHYACLKNWRQQGFSSTSSIRSCPVCRAPSHFIVPCSTPISDQRTKDLLIAAFKLNCYKKVCTTFQRDGTCPFGASCFYRHVDERGAGERESAKRFAKTRLFFNSSPLSSLLFKQSRDSRQGSGAHGRRGCNTINS